MDTLAKELHKIARKNYETRSVSVMYVNEIWAIDLVDLIEWNDENKKYKYLMTIIDVFSKYALAIPLQNKNSETVTNIFEKILKKGEVPTKIWVDKGAEFYNKTFKSLLSKYNIVMYSTYSNNKSVVVERFNRTLKTNMFKKFTQNNNRNWIDILIKLMDHYNNSIHSTTGFTPNDAKKKKNYMEVLQNTIDSKPKLVMKKPKFKVHDNVRISRVKGIFEKGFHPNWSQEIFTIVEVLNTTPITYKLKDMNNDIIEGSFYTEELQKTKLSDTIFVEEILNKKKVKGRMQYYVKFVGLPKKFNKWLDQDDLKDLDKIKEDL